MKLTVRGLLLFSASVIVCFHVRTNATTGLRCEETWLDYSADSCMKDYGHFASRSWFTALLTCRIEGGELLKIRTQEQQDFVQDLIKSPFDFYWTAYLRNELGDVNDDRQSLQDSQNITREDDVGDLHCVALTSLGAMTSSNCLQKNKFFCEKAKFCSPGLFGPKCEKQCHCRSKACTSDNPVCKEGCEPGWTGPACSEMQKAKVIYYCLNTTKAGMFMLMRINLNNITYRAIHGLKNRHPSNNCSLSQFKDEYVYKVLRVFVRDDWTDASGCGGQRVGEHSMRWQFELQEVMGLESPHDLRVELECDFSRAETMSAKTQIKQTKQPQRDVSDIVKLNVTRQEVVLSLDQALTGESLTIVKEGTSVKLSIEIKGKKKFFANGVSPYSCIARSPQSPDVVYITDVNGCPVTGSFVQYMRVDSNYVKISSNTFTMFHFPSSEEVIFECQFDYCFEDQSLCDDRCLSVEMSKRPHIRRSVSRRNPDGGVSSTRIRVINDRYVLSSGISSPTHDSMLIILSVVFLLHSL